MPMADVNGTRLHYRLEGPEDAPVVMLSNSLASDLSMWDEQAGRLIEAGYRVLRYDSRGHGQSAVPPGPYSLEMLTMDAVTLLDALGLHQVAFCGLSKGGMVGQMLGSRYPERLTSLILCSTSAYMNNPEAWDERIAAVRSGGMQVVAGATIDRWFTREGQDRLPGAVDSVRGMILRTPVEGFCASCAAIRDMDLREAITAITTPTLIVVGEHDQGTPVQAAEFIHQRIPSSILRVIPDAAHMVGIEQAGTFTSLLLEFLGSGKVSKPAGKK